MKQATIGQVKAINAILAKKGLREHKAVIIRDATDSRTEHSKEMTMEEARLLIMALNDSSNSTPKEDSRDRMCKLIFALAHEMGWIEKKKVVKPDGQPAEIKDYERLNGWMVRSSYLHKPIREYTYEELPALVTQFKKVHASYVKGLFR